MNSRRFTSDDSRASHGKDSTPQSRQEIAALRDFPAREQAQEPAAGGCGQIVLVGQPVSGYAWRHGGGIVRSQSQ